ncbi:MAG: ribonucleotide reductase N-terminal alpha domain-containing protein, partial [Gemmatimonadota bacterium]
MQAPRTANQADAATENVPSIDSGDTPNDLPRPRLTENAITVLGKRYLRKNDDLELIEEPKDMFWRVARVIAGMDARYGASKQDVEKTAREFYEMMASGEFEPNSPTLMNAGRPLGQLSACFVLPVPDSLEGIYGTLKDMALIHQSGGGCVSGDAHVHTTFCGVETIETLYGRVAALGLAVEDHEDHSIMDVSGLGIETLAIDPDTGAFSPKQVTHLWKWDVPAEKQFTVRCEDGCEATTSAWHPFMVFTPDGIVERRTDELQAGDLLLTPNTSAREAWPFETLFEAEGFDVDADLAWLVGYALGDGSLDVAEPTAAEVEDPSFMERFARLAGMDGVEADEFTMPEWVAKSPLDVVAAFLGGLVDSESAVSVDAGCLVFSTEAPELARRLTSLLSTLGFDPAVRHEMMVGNEGQPGYRIRMSSAAKSQDLATLLAAHVRSDILRDEFARLAGQTTAPEPRRIPLPFDAIEDLLQAAGVDTHPTALHRQYVEIDGERFWLQSESWNLGIGEDKLRSLVGALRRVLPVWYGSRLERLERLADGWAVIETVTRAEQPKDFYDFTVEGFNNYLAGGGDGKMLVIHNTGFGFSRLRPSGDVVKSTMGVASGPVSFMEVYDASTEAVKQGGCVVPDTLISTNRGVVPIRELGPEDAAEDSWHGHSEPLQVATDAGPQDSDEFYNHGMGPVRRIRTKAGYAMAATPQHRIRVIDADSGYVWRRMDELKAGDWVAMQKGHLMEPADYSLPAFEGTPQFNATEVRLPDETSELFGEFLGYLIGDGSFNRYGLVESAGHVVLTVDASQPDVAAWLTTAAERLFGLTPIQNRKRDGSVSLYLSSPVLVDWLRQLGATHPSSRVATVPELVFRKGLATARGFLRGLFTANGAVSEDGSPLLVSASAELITGVQQLLLAVGVPSAVSTASGPAGRPGYGSLHEICVISDAGLDVFVETIGSLDEGRIDRLPSELGASRDSSDLAPAPYSSGAAGSRNLTQQGLATL